MGSLVHGWLGWAAVITGLYVLAALLVPSVIWVIRWMASAIRSGD